MNCADCVSTNCSKVNFPKYDQRQLGGGIGEAISATISPTFLKITLYAQNVLGINFESPKRIIKIWAAA